jgi:hypothetical protein
MYFAIVCGGVYVLLCIFPLRIFIYLIVIALLLFLTLRSYIVLIGVSFGSALPLFYEYGVELTYPLHESSFMLTLAINIGALVFLLIINEIPAHLMNLCLSCSMLLCSFLLFRVQGEYKRSKYDADKLES